MLTLLTTLSFAQATEEAAKKCVEDLDADGDGRISFPEFLLAWKFKQ
jgi:Ca2+-binding EF-hand superfamily protein